VKRKFVSRIVAKAPQNRHRRTSNALDASVR